MSAVDLAQLPPLLLPRPTAVQRHGGRVSLPADAVGAHSGAADLVPWLMAQMEGEDTDAERRSTQSRAWLAIRIGSDATGPPPHAGAYRLFIGVDPSSPAIRIDAPDRAGVRHALATLAQLIGQYGSSLPRLVIEDRPAFPNRGVMLDISRDRVPTMEHLFDAVRLLAGLKFNHLQLYTEHTFAYAGHEEVWRDASPITPDETRRLDAHCRSLGVTLAANQNCFGHVERWLRHARYRPLAEMPDSPLLKAWPIDQPMSLCPTDPGSLALVRDLLQKLLPCFSAGVVNIGCDETIDLKLPLPEGGGWGVGSASAFSSSSSSIPNRYSRFVSSIAAEARRLGSRPMFWADMAIAHPETLDDLPRDLIALVWGYEPDSPFQSPGSLFRDRGMEWWACPGTSSWLSITGRTTERRANLAAAARQGLAAGAAGFLVTDWGDQGHRQQWPISLIGLAEAAEAAWSGSMNGLDDRATSLHAFDDRSLSLAAWLARLGDADRPLRSIATRRAPGHADLRPLINRSALYTDLHSADLRGFHAGGAEDWAGVLDALTALESSCPRSPSDRPAAAPVDGELAHTLAVARLAAQVGAARRQTASSAAGDLRALAATERARFSDALRATIAEHRRLWPMRSRPGGLDDSAARYETILASFEGRR